MKTRFPALAIVFVLLIPFGWSFAQQASDWVRKFGATKWTEPVAATSEVTQPLPAPAKTSHSASLPAQQQPEEPPMRQDILLNRKAEQTASIHPAGFVPNRGQVADPQGRMLTDVRYLYRDQRGFQLQLRKDGFSFEKMAARVEERVSEATSEKQSAKTFFTHRVDIRLVGANPNPLLEARGELAGHFNYYVAGAPKSGAARVSQFGEVVYKDIYPNIDLVFRQSDQQAAFAQAEQTYLPTGMKYEFVVRPGGNPSQIRLAYEGSEGQTLDAAGNLVTRTSLGDVLEKAPVSFTQDGQPVASAFVLEAGELTLAIGDYDREQTLVIDPETYHTRRRGTYLGGSGTDDEDRSFALWSGADRKVYIAGLTNASAGFATSGVFKDTTGSANIFDAFAARFDEKLETLEWATYYGGAEIDEAIDITVSDSGDVYLLGITKSDSLIATSGAHQTSLRGSQDLFVARLKADGTRNWGTYYGGGNTEATLSTSLSNNEIAGAIAMTDDEGVVFVSSTQSSDFIATSSSHQSSFGGLVDAMVVKLDSTGARDWGTYIGNNTGLQYATGVSVSDAGDIYVTGSTTRETDKIHTSGTHKSSKSGSDDDAFLIKFNASGSRQWGTYFGGDADDKGFGVVYDDRNDVIFICGFTESFADIATTGAHQTSIGGFTATDGFVAKFDDSGGLGWGSYFGGNEADVVTDISIDRRGYAVFSGVSNGTNNIAFNDPFQTSNGGAQDAFLGKFEPDGVLQWSTYYGSSADDRGMDAYVDNYGAFIISGFTRSTSTIATSEGHDSDYNSSDDAFVARFCDLFYDSISLDINVWKGETTVITADVKGTLDPSDPGNTFSYQWQKKNDSGGWGDLSDGPGGGDGSSYSGTGTPTLTITNTQPEDDGEYRLIVTCFCNEDETTGLPSDPIEVNVRDSPDDQALCTGESATLSFFGLDSTRYAWYPSTWLSDSLGNQVTVTPVNNTFDSVIINYIVVTTDTSEGGQIDTVDVQVVAKPNPRPVAGNDTIVCADDTVQLGEPQFPNYAYTWLGLDPEGTTVSDSTIAQPTTSISNTTANPLTIRYEVSAALFGCSAKDTATLTINPRPIADFAFPSEICPNDLIELKAENLTSANDTAYRWSLINGLTIGSLVDATLDSTGLSIGENQASPSAAADSTVSVTLQMVSTPGACSDEVTKDVRVKFRPRAEIILTDTTCGDTLQTINNTLPDTVGYLWTVPAGITILDSATQRAPELIIPSNFTASPISYQVIFRADTSGCVDADTLQVTTFPAPITRFTVDDSTVCDGTSVICTNLSDPRNNEPRSSMTFQWLVNDSLVGTSEDLTYQFRNFGTETQYDTLQLVGITQHGCATVDTAIITVFPNPQADILEIAVEGCAPFTVDSSAIRLRDYPDANVSYEWTFINSSGTTVATGTDTLPPSFDLATGGQNLEVILKAESGNGCGEDTDTVICRSIVMPGATFTLADNIGCSPFTVNPVSNSPNAQQHQWLIGEVLQTDTTTTPSFTLTNNSAESDSLFTLSLVVVNESICTDTASETVTVQPKPIAAFTLPATACAKDTAGVTENTSLGKNISYDWEVDDVAVVISDTTAELPSFIFPDNQSGTANVYTIRLTVTSADGCTDFAEQTIRVNPRPVANFSMNPPACGNGNFTPTPSFAGVANFNWTASSRLTFLTSQNTPLPNISVPANNTTAAISYDLDLIAENSLGCRDTTTKSFTVFPIPNVAFTLNPPDGCDGTVVSTVNASDPYNGEAISSMNFVWTFQGGFDATSQNISKSLANTSTGDVRYTFGLQGLTQHGCQSTAQDTAVIYPYPVADFSASQTAACAPFALDNSIISRVSYANANDSIFWNILDADRNLLATSDSRDSIPAYTINVDNDTVIYQLVAANAHGCRRDTAEILFRTFANPIAGITTTDTVGCHPYNTSLGTATPGLGHLWASEPSNLMTISNAAAENPSFTFENQSHLVDSSYEVSLIVTSAEGCKDTAYQMMHVLPQPAPVFSFATVDPCAASTVGTLNDSEGKNPLTFSWQVVSGTGVSISDHAATTPDFTFPDNQSGTDLNYTVRLRVTSADGCQDSADVDLTVRSRPVADFSIDPDVCGFQTLIPNDLASSISTSYAWSVDDAGVSVTDGNTAAPRLGFPRNTSDFAVDYTVKQVAGTAFSCQDSTTEIVRVYPEPSVVFTTPVDTACASLTTTFTNNSDPKNGELIGTMDFIWRINGDSVSDSRTAYTHTFGNTGVTDSVYVVTLEGVTQHGCDSIASDTIRIYPLPVAELVPDLTVSCAPFTIDSSVLSRSLYPDANDFASWTILNKSRSVVATSDAMDSIPAYTILTDADTAYFQVIMTNEHGCAADTAEVMFRTIQDPEAVIDASATVGCHPLQTVMTADNPDLQNKWTVSPTALVTIADDTATAANILFENNSSTTDASYALTLTVTAATGCSDDTTINITVHPKPVASFGFVKTDTCAGATVGTTNGTSSKGFAQTSFGWAVTSGLNVAISDSALATPNLTFPDNQSGTDLDYTVELMAESEDGCRDTVDQVITMRSRPEARFGVDAEICEVLTQTVLDSASAITDAYRWSESTNAVTIAAVTDAEPSLTFPRNTTAAAIRYTLQQRVESLFGCADSTTRMVTVFPEPSIAFGLPMDTICRSAELTLPNQSDPFNSELRSSMIFQWVFNGDTVSMSDTSFTYTFTNEGIRDSLFALTLVGETQHGCVEQLTDSLVALPPSRAEFNPVDTIACAPFTIRQAALNFVPYDEANDAYQWFVEGVANGADSSFTDYTIHTDDDTVVVMLVATNVHGCEPDTMRHLFITIKDPEADFSRTDTIGCTPLAVDLTYSGSDVTGYAYRVFGPGNPGFTSSDQNPSFSIPNVGFTVNDTFDVELIVTAATGCKDTAVKQLVVKPLPRFSLDTVEACVNDDTLQLTYTLGTSPLQTVSQVIWSSASLPAGALTPDGIFDPGVAGVSTGGHVVYCSITEAGDEPRCERTDSMVVIVHPIPEPNFDIDPVYCINETITFPNTTPAISGYTMSHEWEYAAGAGFSPSLPNGDGEHVYADTALEVAVTLIPETDKGCRDTLTQRTRLVAPPHVEFATAIAPTDSCGPVRASFTNRSSGYEIDYFWDFGNGVTSTRHTPDDVTFIADPFRVKDTTYYVSLRAVNLCDTVFAYDTITVKPLPFARMLLLDDTICAYADTRIFNNSKPSPALTTADLTYRWNLGDGTIFTTADSGFVDHAFPYDGPNDTTYTIELIAQNECGADTVPDQILVVPSAVTAAFRAEPGGGCAPQLVEGYTILSTAPNNRSIVSWFVNDSLYYTGAIAGREDLARPKFLLEDPGQYVITLSIFLAPCHVDTLRDTINLIRGPIARIDAPDSVCFGDDIVIANFSNTFGNVEQFELRLDGQVVSRAELAQYTLSAPAVGEHFVELRVFNNQCEDIDSLRFYVLPPPVPGFDYQAEPFCAFKEVQLVDTTAGARSVQWEIPAIAFRSTLRNPVVTFYVAGTFDVTLTGFLRADQTDSLACPVSLTRQININPIPEIRVDTSSVNDCGIWTYTFTNNTAFPSSPTQGTVQMLGHFVDGLPAFFQGQGDSIQVRYRNGGDTVMRVEVVIYSETTIGCNAFDTIQIRIPPYGLRNVEEELGGYPLLFSPYDGDGVHDFVHFSLFESGEFDMFQLQVFDRWGVEVFKTLDPTEQWAGTYEGKRLPAGVYQAIITYRQCFFDNTSPRRSVRKEIILAD